MKLAEIEEIVKNLKITDDYKSMCFFAAVVILYGISNDTVSVNKIKKGTGYCMRDVDFIISNLWKNGLIEGYRWCVPLSDKLLDFSIELTLAAMSGSGEVVTQKYLSKDPRFV